MMMTRYYRQAGNKYNSKKVVIDGMVFDSKKEARRYNQLKIMENAGQIYNLDRQHKFILIPAQYEQADEYYTKGEKKGQRKKGKIIERECAYYADFIYQTKDGKLIVEDTKGVRTKDYVIKRKLMLYVYGIRIIEI